MTNYKNNTLYFLFALTFSFLAQASDHIDGVPSLSTHEQVDLTDLYVFPSQEDAERITLILNMYPGAELKSHFSHKVGYNFILKPLSLPSAPSSDLSFSEMTASLVINCEFSKAHSHGHSHHHEKQSVTCKFKQGAKVLLEMSDDVDQKATYMKKDNFKIFAGHKADPFFLSFEHFNSVTGRDEFPEAHADWEMEYLPALLLKNNLMEGLNILTLSLEVKKSFLEEVLETSLFALTAQSYITENNKVLDQVGRPEITNLSLHAFENAKQLKVRYNARPDFINSYDLNDVPTKSLLDPIKQRLFDNINAYDALDENTNWEKENLNQLVDVLAKDFLVFDTSKPVLNKMSFFEIEMALLKGQTHESFGGRLLTDDIMLRLYALYIGGLYADLQVYNTGINTPYISSDKELSDKFPYMAPAWKDQWFIKSKLLQRSKGSQEGEGVEVID